MNVVSAQIVRKVVAAARAHVDREGLLQSVGLSLESPAGNAPPVTIAAEAYYSLVERLGREGGLDPELPFRYARSVTPDDFGAMGLAFKTASTVRAALECAVRYLALLTDTAVYELRQDSGRRDSEQPLNSNGICLLLHRRADRPGARLTNEFCLAELLSLLRQVTGSHIVPGSVEFQHAAGDRLDEHRQYFGCPVRFRGDLNALRFSAQTLETPVLLGDDGLSRYLQARLDEDLRSMRRARNFEEQVRFAITDAFSEGVPRMGQIAKRLGIGERTLARRLADRGQAYQTLLDAARQELAASLLRYTDYSLLDVTFLTGFSEQSAFQRAFKRWTGLTPTAFRARQANSAPIVRIDSDY